jgi:DNA polymerase-3 subunit beta
MTTVTTNKVVFKGSELKELKTIIKGVKLNKHVSILNMVKIDLHSGYIVATLINLDYSITKKIEVSQVTGEGSILLPIEDIKQVKGIKNNEDYILEFEDKKATFNNITFNTYDVEDYPKSNKVNYVESVRVTNKEIKKINESLLSVSNKESRPILTGVLICSGKMISTDSHRLYMTSTDIQFDQDIVISSKGLNTLKDHFKTDIIVSLSDYYLKFEDDNTVIEVRLLEGNYPDVSRIIPDTYDNKTTFKINNLKQLVKTIEDAGKVSSDKSQVMKFTVIKNEDLLISSSNIDKEYENYINTSDQNGEDLKIAMSCKFTLEALKQLNSNSVQFYFYGNMRPFLIIGEDKETVTLVLPVRTY